MIREIEFTLKDGRKALIRSPKDEDIQGMLDYLYISAGETEFILRYPEECSKYTPEGEKALFDSINASETQAMLVCLVDGKVAGNCGIHWNTAIKTRHRASVAIALLKEYWNQGIGTEMLKRIIEQAKKMKISVIELEVISDNVRGIHLYHKMGFVDIGIYKKFFYVNGMFKDAVVMQKLL